MVEEKSLYSVSSPHSLLLPPFFRCRRLQPPIPFRPVVKVESAGRNNQYFSGRRFLSSRWLGALRSGVDYVVIRFPSLFTWPLYCSMLHADRQERKTRAKGWKKKERRRAYILHQLVLLPITQSRTEHGSANTDVVVRRRRSIASCHVIRCSLNPIHFFFFGFSIRLEFSPFFFVFVLNTFFVCFCLFYVLFFKKKRGRGGFV